MAKYKEFKPQEPHPDTTNLRLTHLLHKVGWLFSELIMPNNEDEISKFFEKITMVGI
jgi:hypothetical protein